MARGVSKCPQCGEPVSPFAAGCAICGADLDEARRKRAERRRLELPSLPGPGRFGASLSPVHTSTRLDLAHVLVAALLAVFAPPIGLLLALYWAWQRYNAGEATFAVALLACAGLAGAALFAPVWFWSHLLGI